METTKQKDLPNFQIGDKVIVTKVRDGLGRQVGATGIVVAVEQSINWQPEDIIVVRWDNDHVPKQQRCYPDQFEIVTQVKVMEDMREYLEVITSLERSSNG